MSNKKTLILGASSNPNRYSYLAANKLQNHGHSIVEVGRSNPEIPAESDIHTVTMYLNKVHQKAYENQVLALKPQRVVFNPGAENPEFANELEQNGIEAINACTLVMLSTNQY